MKSHQKILLVENFLTIPKVWPILPKDFWYFILLNLHDKIVQHSITFYTLSLKPSNSFFNPKSTMWGAMVWQISTRQTKQATLTTFLNRIFL
jgi:hypothetical protein